MNILTCTDSRFVIPTGIMLTSVCNNNQGDELNFFLIIDSSVTDKQKKSLEYEVKKFEKSTIRFFTIDVEDLKKYLVVVAPNFPVSIYYRLLLADILPQDLNKILYLDGDIIVTRSLKSLWETDISNYSLGAVVNQTYGKNFWERLNYPREKGYFNSGVLLVNVKYWRENTLSVKFIDYLKHNSNVLVYPDQDVLNFILQDSKLLLPERYNMQEFFYRTDREKVDCENSEEIEKYLFDPTILHYTGKKPWSFFCHHPLKSLYYKCKAQTQWAKDKSMEIKNFSNYIDLLKYIIKQFPNYKYINHYKHI